MLKQIFLSPSFVHFQKIIQEELEEVKREKNDLQEAYNSTQQAQEAASEKIQVAILIVPLDMICVFV